MKSKSNNEARVQRIRSIQGEGPNWVIILGGALLSTLSIRLGYKLRQVFDGKQRDNPVLKGSDRFAERRKLRNCRSNSSLQSFVFDDNRYFNCASGGDRVGESKNPPNGQILTQPEVALPLVTVPAREYSMVWVSSPDRGDLPPRPFQESNSGSPSVSESSSDFFSKREVIQKLRHQLKRRDDMVLEMQDQIAELQTAFGAQIPHSNNLQSQLDSVNKDLIDSGREIQILRKAIADHCLAHGHTDEKHSTATIWQSVNTNGYANGFTNGDSNLELSDRSKGADGKIELLRKEIGELKDVIEGKEFLLQNYKEQKVELSGKLKELQQRLDSRLPHIL